MSVRQPITVWALLVWAFQRQRVLDATDSPPAVDMARVQGSSGSCGAHNVGVVMAGGVLGDGCSVRVPAWTGRCHPDADRVWWWVQGLEPDMRRLVVATACRGAAPVWDIEMPPLQVLPRLKRNGRPDCLTDATGRPIACLIDIVGTREEDRAANRALQRQRYDAWWRALWMLHEVMAVDNSLSRWIVAGIGAERTPWDVPHGAVVAVA